MNDKLLRPVRCLPYYMSQTRTFRSRKQGRVFMSYQRVYDKGLSASSIFRHLKQAIAMAHSDMDPTLLKSVGIKPHSVRHFTTSLSALKHFSVDDLITEGT